MVTTEHTADDLTAVADVVADIEAFTVHSVKPVS